MQNWRPATSHWRQMNSQESRSVPVANSRTQDPPLHDAAGSGFRLPLFFLFPLSLSVFFPFPRFELLAAASSPLRGKRRKPAANRPRLKRRVAWAAKSFTQKRSGHHQQQSGCPSALVQQLSGRVQATGPDVCVRQQVETSGS